VDLQRWFAQATTIPGAPGVKGLAVTIDSWREAAVDVAAAGGRLVSLWAEADRAEGQVVRAAFMVEPGLLVLTLPVVPGAAEYPGLEELFPAASRMQRATRDLTGIHSTDPDTRPWLRHATWPAQFAPLRQSSPTIPAVSAPDAYPFVRVEGDGVHEIPVGPVHAGIIEPGHFRFSVVGEKVLRLEERLGYVHKGIERRFMELRLADGHRLAARVSGDSAVAYSWAYCQALEGAAGVAVPTRAAWLRALALELERIANHLGDLGALGNDAGLAFGLAQFSRLKELLLRAVQAALGQRYLFDFVVPGGTSRDLAPDDAASLAACVAGLEQEAGLLREIYDEHAGLRDRFVGAGLVEAVLAARLGLTGLAGRASGQAFDLRTDFPCAPYVDLLPRKAGRTEGDVAARVALRFDELAESCRLLRLILERLPGGTHLVILPGAAEGSFAIGLIEGWRGPVLVALTAGPGGTIRRCHPHDPSWLNWPVLEHAIIGNIVPDFPLINKSFNLSYSGHDL
jgi:Ni,Fe-hydrogenase III large subunit/Ni,Fe-hydrogenase III component G